jgi:hypothetical protein
MRQRLSRQTRSAQLKAKAAKLREVAGDDPQAVAVADAFLTIDEMLADGYTMREGGPEPRRWPLHEAWGGKEPPENP